MLIELADGNSSPHANVINEHKMKKSTWRKHHKWLGLICAFFLIMFALSGLVLNHPRLFASVNVSRSLLPASYRYTQWNRGLLKGTLKWRGKVLIYGNNGIWMTDSMGVGLKDFNRGLPTGADYRQIKRLCLTPQQQLFALGQYGLYRLQADGNWHEVALQNDANERLVDMSLQGDSLVIASRSMLFCAAPPYKQFHPMTLLPPQGYDGRVSLFRLVWLLHSGELFGIVGVLVVDAIAFVLIFLSLTGVVYFFLPRMRRNKHPKAMRWLLQWHNHVGRLSIVCTLLLSFTGWLLRPPALIAIASSRMAPLPFSTMDSENAWHDKLRSLQYDATQGDWLLYSSEGFYALKTLKSTPKPEPVQPPVSVMGINVEEKDAQGRWLIGSFSGMYRWDRAQGYATDYFDGGPMQPVSGPPIGANAVAGYSNDFKVGALVADYNVGTARLPMPQWMQTLPMSLRNVALEVHTGRIYTFLSLLQVFYIFLIGLSVMWCLWSGWKLRKLSKMQS